MKLADAPDALTVEQAAELLGISRGLGYQAVRAGQIPSVRIGRVIRIPRHALEELLGGNGVAERKENGATPP